MKTISGNIHTINEGILSSVGKGRENIINDFLKKTMSPNQYTLNDDLSVTLNSSNVIFMNQSDVPVWVKSCESVQFVRCGMSEMKLPYAALSVTIEDCKKLGKITALPGTILEELIIKDCENVDLSGLSEIEIKKVKIYQCGISTLKGLEQVIRALYVKRCKKLRNWDLENKNNPLLKIENCPLKTFSKPLSSSDVTITNLKKALELDVKLGAVEDLRIEDCGDIQELKISGNKLDTLVVDNCECLRKVESVNCTGSASFVNLPQIEEYTLPTITGVCVFENVKTVPEVQCKRKIVRK